MAQDRWNPEREYDRRQRMERRDWRDRNDADYESQGYDPYADDFYRDGGNYDRRPDYGSQYNTGNFGIPGALGMGGRYYTGGGFFGSRGRQGMDSDYRGNRGYADRFRTDRYRDEDRSFWDKASDEVQSWMGDEEAERRRNIDRQNHHRGRGPRGYTRSDDRISEDVHDRLTDDWMLDASDIEVTVSGGEVTLSGTVDNRQNKRRAEDIVDNISGVSHVQNNLRVSTGNETSQNRLTTG